MSAQSILLMRLLEEGFQKKAWHGPNLRGSIKGLNAADAVWRPARGRHNIQEIVVHAAYWKYAVRRRLLGEKRGSFPLKGSNWFARNGRDGEKLWKDDIRLLMHEHAALMEAVQSLGDRELARVPRGSRVDGAGLIYGIAAHDIYHAGQIQLIKRLRRAG